MPAGAATVASMTRNVRTGWSNTTWTPTPTVGDEHAPRLQPSRLTQPDHWRTPRVITINGDPFHPAIPDHDVAALYAVMLLNRRHTFLVLTGNLTRAHQLLTSPAFTAAVDQIVRPAWEASETVRKPLGWLWDVTGRHLRWPVSNVWLGTTITNQADTDTLAAALHHTPAAHRWLNIVPLGPIRLPSWCDCGCRQPAAQARAEAAASPGWLNPDQAEAGVPLTLDVDWVTVAGQTGPTATPMHPDWVRHLRDQCLTHQVPFTFTAWGAWAPPDQVDTYTRPTTRGLTGRAPQGGHRGVYLDRDGRIRSTNELTTFRLPADWVWVARVGPRNSGRTIDGQTWDQTPPLAT